MKKIYKLLNVMLLLISILLINSLPAAYLETDDKDKTPDPPPRIIRPEPPIIIEPRPWPPIYNGNCVERLINKLTIGKPYDYKGLTVYPLLLSGTEDSYSYLTLDEALSSRHLTIYDRSEVNEVLVETNSKHYIFLMAGEIITGGKQNRILKEDVLIPPYSRKISLPVYCGEEHRWDNHSVNFKGEEIMVQNSMRAAINAAPSQDKIWGEIKEKNKQYANKSPSADYRSIYKETHVSKDLKDYQKSCLRQVPVRQAIGYVALINGRIVGADIFCNPGLFNKLWNKILDSYSLECVGRDYHKHRYYHSEDQVEKFLQQIRDTSCSYTDGIGEGENVQINGRGVNGKGIIKNNKVIHVNIND